MEHFSLVLLPEEKTLMLLNSLKLKFNKEGFRNKVRNFTNDAHVTLAHGYCKNYSDLNLLRGELAPVLLNNTCIKDVSFSIATVKRPPYEKVDYINYWGALSFSNSEIDEIVKKVEDYLLLSSRSETERYIMKVNQIDPSSQGKRIVGDHLNLCNGCRENKLEKALSLIHNLNLNQILFNRVGLKNLFWRDTMDYSFRTLNISAFLLRLISTLNYKIFYSVPNN